MKQIQVVAAIIRKNGKILLARRNNLKENAGKWEFPGGKIGDAEECTSAIRREIEEEMNLEFVPEKYLGFVDAKVGGKVIRLHGVLGSIESDVSSSQDHDQFRWILPQEWRSFELTEADRLLMQKFEKIIEKWLTGGM